MTSYELTNVVALARHSNMSTSYKPALLKALVRIVVRDGALTIPLQTIGHEFTSLYWNQTVVFHLRQAATITKEPEVIHAIRACADANSARYLKDVPAAAVATIDRRMAKILTINVLDRFHAAWPKEKPPLFVWERAASAITLTQEAHQFIRRYAASLELIANYWWASYLEKVNLLAPAIIEKVSRLGAQRSSLTRYLKILTAAGQEYCFYCEREFSSLGRVCVDHVLPWSFLLDDPLWDLVLACPTCNGSKSDRLPDRLFMEKLAQRNTRQAKALIVPHVSPLIENSKLFQLYDAAISLEWPGPWLPVHTAATR
jgi:hypothetical protein